MSSVIVIPARQGSTRLPGKPLINIAGMSLLERVWRIASAVAECERVVIATDTAAIQSHARSFGAEVVLTSENCRNGTERVREAVGILGIPESNLVVNFQGDALLTPPWVLSDLINAMHNNPSVEYGTTAVRLSRDDYELLAREKLAGSTSGTLVVCDLNGMALYFSKSLIPFVRNMPSGSLPVYKHIGIYAFQGEGLERFTSLAPTPLEQAEGLEQLRILENSYPIRVVEVDYRGRTACSIDCPEDVSVAESIISSQGELLSET